MDLFLTEQLAYDVGRSAHLAWIDSLMPQLKYGDRVQVPSADGWDWYVYKPSN